MPANNTQISTSSTEVINQNDSQNFDINQQLSIGIITTKQALIHFNGRNMIPDPVLLTSATEATDFILKGTPPLSEVSDERLGKNF